MDFLMYFDILHCISVNYASVSVTDCHHLCYNNHSRFFCHILKCSFSLLLFVQSNPIVVIMHSDKMSASNLLLF